jgi:hypothetical protein
LEQLDCTLRARGWEPDGASGVHWYSSRYQRPVILWDQPVHASEAQAIPARPRPCQPPQRFCIRGRRRPASGPPRCVGMAKPGRP